MKKQSCKAEQFYASKYRGNNGDAIVVMVKSVRKCGDVILVDVLTGNRRVKKIDVLFQRNKRITKEQAYALQAIYSKTGDLQKVREVAVKLAEYDGRGQQALPLKKYPKDAGTPILQQERFLPKKRKPKKRKSIDENLLRRISGMAGVLDDMANALVDFKNELLTFIETEQ